jgi:acetoin utilization deacetylase AcuC-like enzyme
VKIFTDEQCVSYSHPGHPERPERILGTLAKLPAQTELSISWATPSVVEDSVLLRAHTPEHLSRLEEPEDFDADTPYFRGIGDRARASVGAALAALEAARSGETVFSLMRPPGHHATRNQAMGFCYLSTAAITVLEALATGAKRVAVYDFDVHHGNGTEAILLNQGGATFISIHQYPCYPGTGGRNVGANCFNYPVPPNTARTDYCQVLESAFEHLQAARPDIAVVSAGFDAYARDPLAQGTLEPEDYYWLGKLLRSMDVPVVSLLEGGYSDDLPELIFSYLKGVEGK